MLNIFRLLNSFSGFKLSLWNRSSEKAFLTSPLTPTNEGIKLLLSRSISFERSSSLLCLAVLGALLYRSFMLTTPHRISNPLHPPLPLGVLIRLQRLGAPQHHPCSGSQDRLHYCVRKMLSAYPCCRFHSHDLEHRFSGDPLLKTQHLLGACEYECVGKKTIMARQQLRAGHLRYVVLIARCVFERGGHCAWLAADVSCRFEDESHKVETKRGHSHATNGFYFKKVWIKELGREEWRWAGFKPEVSWNEYEFETIFGGFECPKSLSYCSVLA